MKDSMIRINFTPTDSGLADLISGLSMVSTKYLPNTVRAIKTSVAALQYTWKAYAMGAQIPGTNVRIKSIRGAYAKSIQRSNHNLSGLVWSDSPYAADIEEGADMKDLKKIIPWGAKARMGKNGPYTIVPFRHGSPGSLSAPMPQQVYSQILAQIKAKEFKVSTVKKGGYSRTNVWGAEVGAREYKWGSKYKNPEFPNLENMVVFNVPSSGLETRGQFVTFRVISANPPKSSKSQKGWGKSWVVPSREGYHITKYVVANTKNIIAECIRAGITLDLLPTGGVR